jgi:hypothetical protein
MGRAVHGGHNAGGSVSQSSHCPFRSLLIMLSSCSQYRGSTVEFNTCLNLTNPQFVTSTTQKAAVNTNKAPPPAPTARPRFAASATGHVQPSFRPAVARYVWRLRYRHVGPDASFFQPNTCGDHGQSKPRRLRPWARGLRPPPAAACSGGWRVLCRCCRRRRSCSTSCRPPHRRQSACDPRWAGIRTRAWGVCSCAAFPRQRGLRTQLSGSGWARGQRRLPCARERRSVCASSAVLMASGRVFDCILVVTYRHHCVD